MILAGYTLFAGELGAQEQGAYDSGDDGATSYAGPRDRVPPSTKGGTEHVQAVAPVQRAEDHNLRSPQGGQLIRRPGDAERVDADDPKNAREVRAIRSTELDDNAVMILVNPES